eukprot:CFRG4610T1
MTTNNMLSTGHDVFSTPTRTPIPKISSPAAKNFKVAVRVRPQNSTEHGHRTVINVLDKNVLCFDPLVEEPITASPGRRQRGTKPIMGKKQKNISYAFDEIFDADSSQQEVFEGTTKHLIDGVLDGINATTFAYGATGAGKTHTMLGTEEQPGVMVLTIQELYRRMAENASEKTYEVEVTYVEVYNEMLKDLLEPGMGKSLPLREDKDKGMIVHGLSNHYPKDAEELFQMLAIGNKNRTQHATDANASSSRSHAVFTVYISQRDRTASLKSEVRTAKLLLIDLAGSERALATTNRGERMREGANINKSLLALGNCINALVHISDLRSKGKVSHGHVPYRDSLLTRLLKDSLGGNSRTVMIANVSSSSLWYEDLHNTLKYANRAKSIKVRAVRNSVAVTAHVSEYKVIMNSLKDEIQELKQKLHDAQAIIDSAPKMIDQAPADSEQLHRSKLLAHSIDELRDNYADALQEHDAAMREERHLALTHSQIKRLADRIPKALLSPTTREKFSQQFVAHMRQVTDKSSVIKQRIRLHEAKVEAILSQYKNAETMISQQLTDKTLRAEALLRLCKSRSSVELRCHVKAATWKDVIELQRQEIMLNEAHIHSLCDLVGSYIAGKSERSTDADVYRMMCALVSQTGQITGGQLTPSNRQTATRMETDDVDMDIAAPFNNTFQTNASANFNSSTLINHTNGNGSALVTPITVRSILRTPGPEILSALKKKVTINEQENVITQPSPPKGKNFSIGTTTGSFNLARPSPTYHFPHTSTISHTNPSYSQSQPYQQLSSVHTSDSSTNQINRSMHAPHTTTITNMSSSHRPSFGASDSHESFRRTSIGNKISGAKEYSRISHATPRVGTTPQTGTRTITPTSANRARTQSMHTMGFLRPTTASRARTSTTTPSATTSASTKAIQRGSQEKKRQKSRMKVYSPNNNSYDQNLCET